MTGTTPGGLHVPDHLQHAVLTAENENLLRLRQKTDADSLEASIQAAYLDTARYTDAAGVVRYKTKFDEAGTKALAKATMDALSYHVHSRHYTGMSPEVLASLAGVKDALGNSYLETQVQAVMGVSTAALEGTFKPDKTIDVAMIAGLGQQIGKGYDNRMLTAGLNKAYGSDVTKYRTGLLNLNGHFNLNPGLKETDLAGMGMEDLMRTYVSLLDQAQTRR